MKIWWKIEDGKITKIIIYYVKIANMNFSLQSMSRYHNNKKKWNPKRTLKVGMKYKGWNFYPRAFPIPSTLPYFELEDDKIRFYIP